MLIALFPCTALADNEAGEISADKVAKYQELLNSSSEANNNYCEIESVDGGTNSGSGKLGALSLEYSEILPYLQMYDQYIHRGDYIGYKTQLRPNGYSGQQYVIFTYRGNDVSSDPNRTINMDYFPDVYDVSTMTFWWDTSSCYLGEYTVATMTTSYNSYSGEWEIIDDSITEVTVHMVSSNVNMNGLMFVNTDFVDVGQEITVGLDEYEYITPFLTPLNSTSSHDISVTSPDTSIIEYTNYTGMMCIRGLRPGTAHIYATANGYTATLTVRVVANSSGYLNYVSRTNGTYYISVPEDYMFSAYADVTDVTTSWDYTVGSNGAIIFADEKFVMENGSIRYGFTDADGDRAYIELSGGMYIIKSPFVDVKASDYYFFPVLWAADYGITSGMDATHFRPGMTCTRGQMVTFMWRAYGCPVVSNVRNPFVDVKPGDYYYNAVMWAVANGITSGTDARHFSPNAAVTRAQTVTFLWRADGQYYVSSKNYFTDVKPSDYYYDAVMWAVAYGITNGMDATHFGPNSGCTRGQIVTFLYRFMA